MGSSYFFGPSAGGSTTQVTNFPADQLVHAVDGGLATVGLKADTAWVSGSGSVVSLLKTIAGGSSGTLPNYAQSVKATTSGTTNLLSSTPAGGGNFTSFTALNPTSTDFTVVIGTSNTSTITIQANSTISLDVNTTKLSVVATAALQQVIAIQTNPATT